MTQCTCLHSLCYAHIIYMLAQHMCFTTQCTCLHILCVSRHNVHACTAYVLHDTMYMLAQPMCFMTQCTCLHSICASQCNVHFCIAYTSFTVPCARVHIIYMIRCTQLYSIDLLQDTTCDWPEPYICTVYERMICEFSAKITVYVVLSNLKTYVIT